MELIVSELVDGELKVPASAVLPSPTVEHPTIDVGTVTVAEGRAPDGPPMPGYLKQARRMRLDQGLAERAAAEIAPMIEQLTGWPSLLTGVTIEVVDDIHLSHRRIEAALELPVASGLQGAIARS